VVDLGVFLGVVVFFKDINISDKIVPSLFSFCFFIKSFLLLLSLGNPVNWGLLSSVIVFFF